MVKRIRNNSGIIEWSLGIIVYNLHTFLAASKLFLWKNIASNTACKNRAKRSRYFNRPVTYNLKFAVTALLGYLNLMHVLCLQVAEDYSLDLIQLLMCYSGGTATSHFCCNRQPLPRAFFQCSHLLLQFKEYSLLWIQDLLTYHAARTIITTILYGEA